MPRSNSCSLWDSLSAAGQWSDRALWGAESSVTLGDLLRGSSLGGRLEELRVLARGSENLLPAIRQALKDRASLGEVCGAMQDVFGKYAPTF